MMGLALVWASDAHLLPAAPDQFTYDWRTYIFAKERPRDDIAVILINEQSLRGYPYISPVDRGLLAVLVRFVDSASPKAIGLDVIFDRPTEPLKDDALADTLREAKAPIYLGAIDDRATQDASGLDYQEKFIAKTNRPAGHILFGSEQDKLSLPDQAVRYMLPASHNPPSRPALARLLADFDGKQPEPSSRWIFWRRFESAAGTVLFPVFPVPAHRDDAGRLSVEGSILPESWREAFSGKIVLIGGGFSDRDRHLTPLSVASGKRVNGVEIHAQILAQLRDHLSIHEMLSWQHFLVVVAVTGMGFFAAQRWTLRGGGWVSSVIAFVAIVAAGALLFWVAQILLPSATLFLAWAAGLFAGNRFDFGMRRLKRVLGHAAK
jgi:CHASE2 domain-containing sensor protein